MNVNEKMVVDDLICDYTDEPVNKLLFFKARLYKDLGEKDNRLQVRIIPFQEDIPENEEENLPKFPCFFSNEVYKGKTEKEFGKDQADIVGIIATKNFDYGYILGPINLFEGNTSQKMSNTYPFSEIRDFLNSVNALPKKFNSDSIVIENKRTFMDDNKNEYSIVELFNYKTGDKMILLTSGIIFILSKDKIYMRAGGNKNTNPTAGKSFSAISIEPNQIIIETPLLKMMADDVKLGDQGYHLVGTLGTVIPVTLQGNVLVGLEHCRG